MKKKLLATALVVLVLAAAAVGTQAAIGTRTQAQSVITTGNVLVTLVETFDDTVVENPGTGAITVKPGQTAGLTVAARNDGPNPIYVRIRAVTGIIDQNGAALPNTVQNANGDTVDCVQLTTAPAGWLFQNGWFYYTQILQPGQTTPALITAIGFDAAIGAGYEQARVNLTLDTDGLQTANNPIGAGETVLDVDGWPA